MDRIEVVQDAHTRDVAARFKAIEDPVKRIRAVHEAIARGGLAHSTWAQITRESVRELLVGRTHAEVAKLIGVTTTRVKQLVES